MSEAGLLAIAITDDYTAEDLKAVQGFFDGMQPPPRLTVSEWAQKFRVLSGKTSREPGQWRNERTPYLVEIMDNLSATSIIQEVIVMKGAQLGLTEAGNNWVGYVIDLAPKPMLYVMPTDDTLRRNVKTKIDPMLRETPTLKSKVSEAKSRDGENSTLYKSFPGGFFSAVSAGSPSNLASVSVCNVYLDEIDRYEENVQDEGSPVSLAKQRAKTFGNRKKVYEPSTPTGEDSAIAAAFAATDQRYYFIPCPHCDHRQHLVMDNLDWEWGKPHKGVVYFCEECGSAIEERFKPRFLAEGKWIPTAPENAHPYKRGYHLNSLYSPLGWESWIDIAEQYEKCYPRATVMEDGSIELGQENTFNLRTFTNTALGLVYVESGESPPWEKLYERRDQINIGLVPADVAFLTAGVDIQKDRIEMSVWGWGTNEQRWAISHRVYIGNVEEQDVWNQLDHAVTGKFTRQDGLLMPILMTCIDTGYQTQTVYKWAMKYQASRVRCIKGQEKGKRMVSSPEQVQVAPSGKRIGKTMLWHVWVNAIKEELYSVLRVHRAENAEGDPVGYVRFNNFDEGFFMGLTAEELVTERDKKKGTLRSFWRVRGKQRNEILDCANYARAAAFMVGWDTMTDEKIMAMAPQVQSLPSPEINAQVQQQQKRTRKPGGFGFRD